MRKPAVMSVAALLGAGMLLSAPLLPKASAAVSIDFFYTALEPHGEWVDVGDYGPCWRPRGMHAGWRPYTDGHWVYTDAGWTWVSDEPYGWVVYHYGRWVDVEDEGWCWVPDTEWAPAWVSFRHSRDYIGWAPLPPEARFRSGVSISFGSWVDSYFDIGPRYYSFVPVRRFSSPRLRDVIIHNEQVINIYANTVNITNINYRDRRVFVGGPDYDRLLDRTERRIPRLRLDRQLDFRDGHDWRNARARIDSGRLTLPGPEVRGDSRDAATRVARRLDRAEIDRGWRGIPDDRARELRRSIERAEVPNRVTNDLLPVRGREPGRADRDRDEARREGRDDRNAAREDLRRDGREAGAREGRDDRSPGRTEGRSEREQRDQRVGAMAGRRDGDRTNARGDRKGTDGGRSKGDANRSGNRREGSSAERDRSGSTASRAQRGAPDRDRDSRNPAAAKQGRDDLPRPSREVSGERSRSEGGQARGSGSSRQSAARSGGNVERSPSARSKGGSDKSSAARSQRGDAPRPTREVSGERSRSDGNQARGSGSQRPSSARSGGGQRPSSARSSGGQERSGATRSGGGSQRSSSARSGAPRPTREVSGMRPRSDGGQARSGGGSQRSSARPSGGGGSQRSSSMRSSGGRPGGSAGARSGGGGGGSQRSSGGGERGGRNR